MPDNDTKTEGLPKEDQARFTTELAKRISAIPDSDQQTWYFALVSSALDQTNGDVDKALEVADKAFAEERLQDAQTKSLPPPKPGSSRHVLPSTSATYDTLDSLDIPYATEGSGIAVNVTPAQLARIQEESRPMSPRKSYPHLSRLKSFSAPR